MSVLRWHLDENLLQRGSNTLRRRRHSIPTVPGVYGTLPPPLPYCDMKCQAMAQRWAIPFSHSASGKGLESVNVTQDI